VAIVVNEQCCSGDTMTVNALHILVGSSVPLVGGTEIIVAHSVAGATGCGCTACAQTSPLC
jgi:hypothetical protein